MASGCAVIASALEGFVEVLGDAGMLVPAADPDALAAAIRSLLGAPEELARYQQGGRVRAAGYDWRNVVPRYELAYRRASSTS